MYIVSVCISFSNSFILNLFHCSYLSDHQFIHTISIYWHFKVLLKILYTAFKVPCLSVLLCKIIYKICTKLLIKSQSYLYYLNILYACYIQQSCKSETFRLTGFGLSQQSSLSKKSYDIFSLYVNEYLLSCFDTSYLLLVSSHYIICPLYGLYLQIVHWSKSFAFVCIFITYDSRYWNCDHFHICLLFFF